MMRFYINWIIRYRKIMLGILMLVTAAFITQLGNLEVIFDAASALPQNHPYVVVTNRVREMFGNDNMFIIGVTSRSGTVFQSNTLAIVKRINDQIENLPEIVRSSVLSIAARKAKNIFGTEGVLDVTPMMALTPSTQEGLDKISKKIRATPLYTNILISADEKTLFITANFKNSPKGFRIIVDNIKKIIDQEKDSSVDIYLGGEPVFVAAVEEFSMRMGPLFLLALLIIGLIHYEAFRTMQALALPLVTALLAVIWSLGMMGIMGIPVDPFNATTPILILAIAAGHAVQILKRYYEEYNRIKTLHPNMQSTEASHLAITRSVEKVGPVMIAAGIVAAASFFSLMVFEIKVIKAFGIFTGLGILFTLFLEMSFIPAIRAMLKPPALKESTREKQINTWDRVAQAAARLSLFKRKRVYWITFILSVGFLIAALRLHVDGANRKLFYGNIEILQSYDKLNAHSGGTHVLYGLLEGDHVDAIKNPKTLDAMTKIQSFIETQPKIGKTISIADFVKRLNFSMNGNDKKFDRIPDTPEAVGQYLFLYSTIGDPDDFNSYVDNNYQNALITIFLKDNHTDFVRDLIDKTTVFAKGVLGSDIKFSMGGGASSAVALSDVIVHEKILNILQIIIVVFIACSILFRSIVAGLLIIVPLIMTVLGNLGLMGILGIPLQVATAVVSAMGVGIGADYAIYLTYRMREELRGGGDETEAVQRAFGSSGKAILFVSSAVAGGYSVLMLSYGFNIHLWLGLLICTAMIFSGASSLTLFPSLILSFRPKFIFGNTKK
jgi:predicted RND superfamily exporter protein